MKHIEISDGSTEIQHQRKCELIYNFARDYTVLSEVGSKDEEKINPPYEWTDQMNSKLALGRQ